MAPPRATWKCGNALSIMGGGGGALSLLLPGVRDGWWQSQPTANSVHLSVLVSGPSLGSPENREGTMVMLSLS